MAQSGYYLDDVNNREWKDFLLDLNFDESFTSPQKGQSSALQDGYEPITPTKSVSNAEKPLQESSCTTGYNPEPTLPTMNNSTTKECEVVSTKGQLYTLKRNIAFTTIDPTNPSETTRPSLSLRKRSNGPYEKTPAKRASFTVTVPSNERIWKYGGLATGNEESLLREMLSKNPEKMKNLERKMTQKNGTGCVVEKKKQATSDMSKLTQTEQCEMKDKSTQTEGLDISIQNVEIIKSMETEMAKTRIILDYIKERITDKK